MMKRLGTATLLVGGTILLSSLVVGLLEWSKPQLAQAAAIPQTTDICSLLPKSTKPIDSTGAANYKLVTGVSSKLTYVCSINVGPIANTANIALVEGTKTTNECDTSPKGMAGGATAAKGWQFIANGGLTFGNGLGTVAQSTVAANDVCLLFSATGQVSGVITYVQN